MLTTCHIRMTILYLNILLLIIVNTSNLSSVPYKVAVMNYEAEEMRQDAAQDIIIRNAAAYGKHMERAGDVLVDLIVFPVGGLTTLTPFSGDYDLYLEYSVDLTNYTENPCNSPYWREPERKAVRDISCSALINNIYAIVNLLEKEYTNDPNGAEYFLYNTNIVFDNVGDIILRYRKTIPNIGNVAEINQRNDFRTPFGNFTTMIGDDLLIYPRSKLNSNITVILTTAQTNLLKPSGIIFYDGLRRAEKTHLLVSEYINENNQSCSCVYAPDRMVEAECSTNIRSMIHTIKLNSKETSQSVNDLKSSSQPTKRDSDRQNKKPITITNILDIELHKVKITNIKDSHYYNYWCEIKLRDAEKSITDTNYCAFQISTTLNFFSNVQLCGVIACTCNSNGTCEFRSNPHNSTLQVSISPIKRTNNDITKEKKYLPITSDYSLRPLERYEFDGTANLVKMSVNDGIDTLMFGLLEMSEKITATTDKVESRGGTENSGNSGSNSKGNKKLDKNSSNKSRQSLFKSLVTFLILYWIV